MLIWLNAQNGKNTSVHYECLHTNDTHIYIYIYIYIYICIIIYRYTYIYIPSIMLDNQRIGHSYNVFSTHNIYNRLI